MNKKQKKSYDFEDIIKQDHYRSILFLTDVFQYHQNENGLKQNHYRWILIENHGGINQTSLIQEMRDFFSKSMLSVYIGEDLIIENCIKGKYANNNLTNFLNKLSDHYNLLEKYTDSDGFKRYKVNKEVHNKLNLYNLFDSLKEFDRVNTFSPFRKIKNDMAKELSLPIVHLKDELNDNPFFANLDEEIEESDFFSFIPHVLGMDSKFLDECTDEEKSKILKILKQCAYGFTYLWFIHHKKTGRDDLCLNLLGRSFKIGEFVEHLKKIGIDIDQDVDLIMDAINRTINNPP